MSKIFTLDWFIQKYGKELGQKNIMKDVLKSLNKQRAIIIRNKTKNNIQKYPKNYFGNYIRNLIFNEIYFGELNHEYGCETNQNFDFVILDNKKIIEFNGDKWHANPKLFEENDIVMPGF